MDETARREFLRMVASYRERGDPTGWFDKVYRDAQGDIGAIFWADLVPNPHLVSWLEDHPIPGKNPRAVTVGCGVGDDAEALSAHGYRVVGFDISPTAIDLCRKRYPDSHVEYRVADLFDHPRNWTRGFDLVFECNTIQALPGEFRVRALNAIADLVAPGGAVLSRAEAGGPGKRKTNSRSLSTGRKSTDSSVPDSGKRLSSPTTTSKTRRSPISLPVTADRPKPAHRRRIPHLRPHLLEAWSSLSRR